LAQKIGTFLGLTGFIFMFNSCERNKEYQDAWERSIFNLLANFPYFEKTEVGL
jgi:hypothetical protein